MCLQEGPCLAVVQALPYMRTHMNVKNKLRRVRQFPLLLPLRGRGLSDGHELLSLEFSFCTAEMHRKLSGQIRAGSTGRDLEAVVKKGCSDKAEGCDNQIGESLAAKDLDLVLEKVYLKYANFNKFHQ